MNVQATIGHNNPPDAIETIQAAYDSVFSEVANWLDGTAVENEAQMAAVDSLLKSVKECEKEAVAAKEDEYRPHKAACDGVVSRWKPFLDDLALQKKGLTAAVDSFKRKLAEAKEAERRAKEAEAREAMRKAEEAAKKANAADLEAQREAAAAIEAARVAQQAAKDVESVKGLRKFTIREITDGVACARWIWANDRAAIMEFMDAYVKRASTLPDGVTERTERRAV